MNPLHTPNLDSSLSRKRVLATSIASILLGLVSASQAQLYFDANGATAGSGTPGAFTWDVGTNWSDDPSGAIEPAAWVNGSAAIFSAGTEAVGTWTVTIGGLVQTNFITFTGTANTVHNITGGLIDIGINPLTIDSTAAGAAAGRSKNISSAIVGSGGVILAVNGDQSNNGGSSNTIFTLSGANTFTGGVAITSGVVSAASNFGDFSNAITLDGGGLVANVNTTLSRDLLIGTNGGVLRSYGAVTNFTLAGKISGTGAITRTDGGTAYFTGDLSELSGVFNQNAGNAVFETDSSMTGAVLINAGTLWVGNNGTKGSLKNAAGISINAGSLYVRRSDTVNASDILPANITFNAGSNFEFNPTVETGVLNLDRDLGADPTVGQVRVSGGTMNLVDGTDLTIGSLSIGLQTATNRGTLNILPGSSITTRYVNIGANGNNSGTVNQTGGTATIQGGGDGFRLGHWTNGTNPGSNYNLVTGTLDATGLAGNVDDRQLISIGWDGAAEMVVGGGDDFAILRAVGIMFDRNRAGVGFSAATLTVSPNGTVEIGSRGAFGQGTNDGIILNGGALVASADSTWSAAITAAAGTTSFIETAGVNPTINRSIGGTGTIEVSDFFGTGSLILNSGTGTQIVSAGLGGTGIIRKMGPGTLVLSGSASSGGVLNLNEGTLAVTGFYAGSVNAADSTTVTGEGIIGQLNLGVSAGANLQADPTTTESLVIGGNIQFTAPTNITFRYGPRVSAEPITLFSYGGSLNGFANLVVPGAANYRSATLSDNAGTVTLTLVNKSLTWNGTSGSEWQVGTVNRWNAGEAEQFFWSDHVRFDDTGASTGIALTGELQPGAIVVDSSTQNYTFTGAAGNLISGAGALLKDGTSTLTINAANTFTGGTILSEGTIDVQTVGALGTGAVTIGDSATGAANLALFLKPIDNTPEARFTLTPQVIVSSNGTGTVTIGSRSTTAGANANLAFSSIVLQRDLVIESNANDRTDYRNISGTGNITVTGPRRSIFPTNNTFVGNLTVSTTGTGSLQLGTNSTGLNAIPDTSDVTVTTGALLNLSLAANGAETINALYGAGTIGINGSNATNSPNTLIVGSANGSGDFSGVLRNGTTLALNFTKSGTGTQTLSGVANTYTGVTTASGGVLAVPVILNGGVDSSIGKSTSDATGVVLNGGVLRYIGGAASTDRLFTIGTTAGSGFESSGTGPVAFSNPGAIALSGTNTARTFILGGTNTGANTFNPILGNNGTGATSLIKSGSGTWVLAGLNTYTGVTTIAEGILRIANLANGGVASPIGQSAKASTNLILNGGTLQYTGPTAASDRAFRTGTNGGTFEITDPTATLTLGSGSTPFALAGTLVKSGPGTLRLVSYGGSTATAGSDLVINDGAVEFGTGFFNASPFGYRGLSITVNQGGILRTTTAHALGGDNGDFGSSMGQIRLIGGTLQLNGEQYISGGLEGTEGRIVLQGGVIEGTADLRALNSTITTLPSATTSEIRNTGGITLTYGGIAFEVADGDAASDLLITGAMSNANGVTKTGTGTLELTGASTYAGETAVLAGTLLVNGSITANTTINGGILDGSGTVGAVTLIDGRLTAGGNVIENLATGNLDLIGGTLLFDLDASGSSDQLVATGTVNFNGPIQLSLAFTSDLSDQTTFTLFANDDLDGFTFGTGSGLYLGMDLLTAGVDFTYTSNGFTEIFQVNYAGGDGNDLTLTAIPEPVGASLLLAGFGALVGPRRRRARA